MSTTTEIRESVYAPSANPHGGRACAVCRTPLALDDRDDLSPGEEALAEVLTLLIEDYEGKHYPCPKRRRTSP